MILSQKQIEEIAASTTKDFNRFFFGDEADKPDRSALPTPIDQFAKNYLGLRVSFARLSPDGSICGVTAYADTEYTITELGITRTLALKRNQVILDESFIRSGNVQRLCAKRRFTLAHECAHQILFQLESEEVKASTFPFMGVRFISMRPFPLFRGMRRIWTAALRSRPSSAGTRSISRQRRQEIIFSATRSQTMFAIRGSTRPTHSRFSARASTATCRRAHGS